MHFSFGRFPWTSLCLKMAMVMETIFLSKIFNAVQIYKQVQFKFIILIKSCSPKNFQKILLRKFWGKNQMQI